MARRVVPDLVSELISDVLLSYALHLLGPVDAVLRVTRGPRPSVIVSFTLLCFYLLRPVDAVLLRVEVDAVDDRIDAACEYRGQVEEVLHRKRT